ncbi:arylsulfatase [Anatilimnocola sp. NA78]|uniref:sulfatase family protein n=1 Tax=Anatilimnocola sp. NA78 TaxID=3415683 RepID=UPI003CE4A0D5
MLSRCNLASYCFLTLATAILLVRPAQAEQPAGGSRLPNIVFILADDIGYGDLSCQGAKHAKTPNLDRLAKEGCRFLDAHSPASTCTPTRRALLTGTYSFRQEPGSRIAPGDAALSIDPGTSTIASLMKSAGYRTGVVGKWHIGLGPQGGPDWNGEIKPGPLELGFDKSFIMAATGDRVPTVYVEDRRIVGLDPKDPIKVSYKEKVGTEPTGKENPELLKLKHTHGHDMTIVNGVGRIGWMTGGKSARWVDEDMSDTFVKHAVKFIEQESEKPFFLFFAAHDVHVPRVPHARFKGTSPVGTRGDAIHELDDAVGTLLATLDRLKLTDNTLVIFSSDNGGVMDDGYEDVGKFDYHPNAPLRGTKGTLFEGGHRVPFLARWPGKIKPGTTSNALLALLDLPATFAAITKTAVPADQCRDSVNVLPALLGESKTGRENFVAHTGGTQGPFAVRSGHWKLITNANNNYGKQGKAAPKGKGAIAGPQLYDLEKDPAEEHNLIESNPEKAAEIKALLAKIRNVE